MNQYQYGRQNRQRSGGGCGKIALIGGGCLLVVILGFVGLLIVGGFFWDRGTEAGGNLVSDWVSDQIGTDIEDRANAIDDVTADLPEAREFDDRDSYLEFLDSYNREFVASMERIARLVQNPQLRNDAWADDVAREIALIRHLEDEARDVTPPEEFSEAHQHWVTGMDEYRKAIDSTASALDNVSPNQLADAISSLNSATQSYISMAESLDEMGALEDMETIEELRNLERQR